MSTHFKPGVSAGVSLSGSEEMSFSVTQKQKKPATSRPRGQRTPKSKFSEPTLKVFSEEFIKNQRPDKKRRELLAEKTGTTPKQVFNWFDNNRKRAAKRRKQRLDPDEEENDDNDEHSASLQRLVASFEENAYPSKAIKLELANQTGKTTKQIAEWFHHRRQRNPRFLRSREHDEEDGLKIEKSKFSSKQHSRLFKELKKSRYPNISRRQELAEELGMTFEQVTSWFKRYKFRIEMDCDDSGDSESEHGSDEEEFEVDDDDEDLSIPELLEKTETGLAVLRNYSSIIDSICTKIVNHYGGSSSTPTAENTD